MTKRILSTLLVLAMVLTMLPALGTPARALTQNQQNIIDRADYLYSITWECQKTVDGWRYEHTFEKGGTYRIPYAQPINAGAYVGYSVSVEDFLAAAADSTSKFYTKKSTYNGADSVYYGMDCSSFVSWCWGLSRGTTYTIPQNSINLGSASKSNIRTKLQPGDCLNSTSAGHAVLCTDMRYDAQGNLIEIEITEQTPPQLKRSTYTVTELANLYSSEYTIQRYSGAVPASPNSGYVAKCEDYAAHGTVELTQSAHIMTQPCTTETDAGSTLIQVARPGQRYEATRLYQDPEGGLWYRIALEGEQVGYLRADATTFVSQLLTDITLTNPSVPNAHIVGQSFNVEGTISASCNDLTSVTVAIRQGFDRNGAYVTGSSAAITGNVYSLKRSAVDSATAFRKVQAGANLYTIQVGYVNHYVTADGTIATNSGTYVLQETFFIAVEKTVDQSTCDHKYTATTVSTAGCTSDELVVYGCATCGHVYQRTAAGGHTFGATTVLQKGDCVTPWRGQNTCTACGYVRVTEIKAPGHQYESVEVIGTCKTYPYTQHTCSACGDSYNTFADEISSDWQADMPELDSSLIQTGTQYRHSNHEYYYSTQTKVEGYSYVGASWITSQPAPFPYVTAWPKGFDTAHEIYGRYNVEPITDSETETCKIKVGNDSTVGYIYYHWCHEDSFFALSKSEGLYTVFHAFYSETAPENYRCDSNDDSYLNTDATCCDDSQWYYVVEVTGRAYTQTDFRYVHERWTDWSDWSMEPSIPSDICRVETRPVYRYPQGPYGGHGYTPVVTTPPTCMEKGEKTFTCGGCGDSYTEVIPATGHSYAPTVTAPTCEAGGYTTYLCDCGDSYTADRTPALGHSYVDGVCATCGQPEQTPPCTHEKVTILPGKDATCTESGLTEGSICADCGHVLVEQTEIPVLGHTEVIDAAVDATCTETGLTEGKHCEVCGEITVAQEEVAALGHSYADGICGTCGEADPDYIKPVVQPVITVGSPSVSFEGEIRYNIYFSASQLDDVTEMGLVLFNTKVADGTIENADQVIPGYTGENGSYMVHTDGIAPKNMGDALYFRIYAKLTDGSYVYTAIRGYNAIVYANNILKNSTDANMRSLVVAMLNYGAAAQQSLNYKTDSLMNAGLTAEHQALVKPYDANMMDDLVAVDTSKLGNFAYNAAGFSGRKPSVSFDGAFAINYYFTTKFAPENGMKLYYWTLSDYNAAATLTAENASGSMDMVDLGNNQFWGHVEDIVARDIDQTVFVAAVYTYGGVEYATGVLAYSVGSYCESMIAAEAGSATQAMTPICSGAAVYGFYAKEYFNNLENT